MGIAVASELGRAVRTPGRDAMNNDVPGWPAAAVTAAIEARGGG